MSNDQEMLFGGFFPGKYHPDNVDRQLKMIRNNSQLEAHLVPLSEEHSLCAMSCDCGVESAQWGPQSIFYHQSELTRVIVPPYLPVQV